MVVGGIKWRPREPRRPRTYYTFALPDIRAWNEFSVEPVIEPDADVPLEDGEIRRSWTVFFHDENGREIGRREKHEIASPLGHPQIRSSPGLGRDSHGLVIAPDDAVTVGINIRGGDWEEGLVNFVDAELDAREGLAEQVRRRNMELEAAIIEHKIDESVHDGELDEIADMIDGLAWADAELTGGLLDSIEVVRARIQNVKIEDVLTPVRDAIGRLQQPRHLPGIQGVMNMIDAAANQIPPGDLRVEVLHQSLRDAIEPIEQARIDELGGNVDAYPLIGILNLLQGDVEGNGYALDVGNWHSTTPGPLKTEEYKQNVRTLLVGDCARRVGIIEADFLDPDADISKPIHIRLWGVFRESGLISQATFESVVNQEQMLTMHHELADWMGGYSTETPTWLDEINDEEE